MQEPQFVARFRGEKPQSLKSGDFALPELRAGCRCAVAITRLRIFSILLQNPKCNRLLQSVPLPACLLRGRVFPASGREVRFRGCVRRRPGRQAASANPSRPQASNPRALVATPRLAQWSSTVLDASRDPLAVRRHNVAIVTQSALRPRELPTSSTLSLPFWRAPGATKKVSRGLARNSKARAVVLL